MAFPNVLSITTTQFNADTTGHACNLPAVVNSGDGLLIIFGMSNIDFANNDMTPPSGFTEKFDDQWDNDGFRQGIGVFIKSAVGDEDGGTANVVTATATSGSAQVYRLEAGTWEGSAAAIEVSVKAESVAAGSTNANPPSHTPSGGSQDYLWIVVGAWDAAIANPTAPANYTNLTGTTGSATEASRLATARRALAAATEDPGVFTSAVEKWITLTISVEPSTATPVAISLTPASIALSAIALGVTPAPAVVALTPALITSSAQALTVVPAALSVTLSPAVLAITAQPLTVIAPVAIALTPAQVVSVAQALTVNVPQPVSIALTPAQLAIIAEALSVELATPEITPAMISVQAQVLGLVLGAVEVQLTPASVGIEAVMPGTVRNNEPRDRPDFRGRLIRRQGVHLPPKWR